MMLIADSGSTKTTWVLTDSGRVSAQIETQGLNPYFIKPDAATKILTEDLAPGLNATQINAVHFYGAGCSTENNNKMLRDSIRKILPDADVHIFHDILGAARALHGENEGIACILGTGCNACYYDGKQIFSVVPSLGFLYGDEGAGSHIGKAFIGKYLKNQLPDDLRLEFDSTHHLTLENILNALYNRPSPNRFLASFSEFIAPRRHHPFLNALVKSSFQLFMDEQVKHYAGYDRLHVGFIGSIAWFYKDILQEVCRENGITPGAIMQSPMEGLIRFHKDIK